MDDESLEQIERQLADAPWPGAPPKLRVAVLSDVERELRASRWDRRLGRAAAALVLLGAGLNVAAGIGSSASGDGFRQPLVHSSARQSLMETAVVLAEATDATTGRQLARQLAAMSGRELTADEAAAIDAAVRRMGANGDRG
jgi:hypothetical protein